MTSVICTGYLVVKRPRTTRFELANVELPAGMTPPEGALTLLYGVVDTMDEIQFQNAKAVESGADLIIVKVTINTEHSQNRTSLASLPASGLLHVGRANKDVRSLVSEKWKQLGQPSPFPSAYSDFETVRPDLIANLHAEDEFKHLDVIIYRISDGKKTMVLASIFKLSQPCSVEVLRTGITVTMPDFLLKTLE